MNYKSVVVYLDDLSQAKSTVGMACEIGEQHQAHLTGVYMMPALELYTAADFPIPQEARDGHARLHQQRSDDIRQLFEQHTQHRDFVAEWRFIDSSRQSIESAVSNLAGAYDLLIMGQKDRSTIGSRQHSLSERVMLNCARPTLLVPPGYTRPKPIKEVLVAFDHSARASRAIFDSMPVLQLADSVTLQRINPKAGEQTYVIDNSKEIVSTLARHGVNTEIAYSAAERQYIGSNDTIGDELLRIAHEISADILVMGAYSHSRLGEQLFGGTTHAILRKMDLPVLMSR